MGNKIKKYQYGYPSKKKEPFIALAGKKRAVLSTHIKDISKMDRIKVFVDDERPCPDGWVLCRTPKEFFDFIAAEKDYLDRIDRISLDWHYGAGWEDGEKLITTFMTRFQDNPEFLSNLYSISFHSSDIRAAIRMQRIYEAGIPQHRKDDIIDYVGAASDTI